MYTLTLFNAFIFFPLTLYFVPPLVQSLDPVNPTSRGDVVCSPYGYQVVEAKFGKENHILCLKTQTIESSPLTSNFSALLLDPGVDEEHAGQIVPLGNIHMAYGFPVEEPHTGSAEGYIGEDNHFYGVLHLGNRTLHADPYGLDDPKKFFGVLENDHMAAPQRPRRDHAQLGAGFDQILYFPFRIEGRKQKLGIARARLCDLLLLADKEFYDQDANSSLNHAVQRMIHAVAQADLIFRNTDFDEDGIPDNIGFSVKYIIVLTSNETNARVFGDLEKEPEIDGKNYLMRFARLRRLSEVCLGVAFSGHAFQNKTLGLSFTSLGGGMGGAAGGLCDRRAYGKSFNTLAVAHATSEQNERVPERVAYLTLAHELGHSFGAHHDDRYPNPECQGYIMGPQSAPSSYPHNSEFSICSKRLITSTLSSMSYCLTEIDRPFCGNGIVEDGESCDCGLPSLCTQRDPCCTPRAGGALAFEEGALHKEGCSVAPAALCHPSQGLCCNADCEYANLMRSGIDCTMQEKQCICPNMTTQCHCGLGGRCLPDGTCHAAECAILGLRECACPKLGPGGILTKVRMCGVCCQIKNDNGSELCIGAELAAQEIMTFSKLPKNWPDESYIGPNVSLQICHDGKCTHRQMRAWSPGDFCVTLNVVGVCSPQGMCGIVVVAPASNIYPDLLNVKIHRRSQSTSRSGRAGLDHIATLFTFLLMI